jgi:hypothetical protein
MRTSAGILLTTAAIFGSSQAFGQQSGQSPVGQPGQNAIGQSGQGIKGQPGQQSGQNPIGQPGQAPVGQAGQAIKGQPGQQDGQNPIGQTGQPIQNPVGQPGRNPIGQPGQTMQGQPVLAGQNPTGQTAPALGTQNHFGVPLYQNADVRRSLNLTDAQIAQLSSNSPQLQQQLQTQLSRLASLPASERAAEQQKLQAGSQQEFWRSATSVFTPEQVQRYHQLEYQYQGPGAFSNPEVRSRLNLTNDQAQRLQELHEQNAHWMQMFLAPGGSGQDAAARYSDYRQQLNEKTNAILNPDQRRIWQGMTGDPYDFRLPVTPPNGTAYFWKP